MTLAELFPREKYPLRARTMIMLPSAGLVHGEERYYTNPLMHISNQESGGLVKIFATDRSLLFSYAFLLHPNNDDIECFIFQDDHLVLIAGETKLDALKKSFSASKIPVKLFISLRPHAGNLSKLNRRQLSPVFYLSIFNIFSTGHALIMSARVAQPRRACAMPISRYW